MSKMLNANGKRVIDSKFLLIFFLFLCFILYSIWAVIMPNNGISTGNPDEQVRWNFLLYIAQHWGLPLGTNPVLRGQNGYGFSYAYLPYVPQYIGAIFYSITKLFTQSKIALLYAARLPSILFSLGTLSFSYETGKRLFSKKITWFLVIMIGMWPEFAMISSYINNDAFALFTVSFIIYSWVRGIQDNWGLKSCILLAVANSLCLLSYYDAFGFVLLSILLVLWTMFTNNYYKEHKKSVLRKIGLMIGICFLLAGWWYVRNAMLYHGDFLGLNSSLQDELKYASASTLEHTYYATFSHQGRSFLAMLLDTHWVAMTFASFIAVFAAMIIYVNHFIYLFYAVLILTGLLGVILGIFTKPVKTAQKKIEKIQLFYICLALSVPIPILLSAYRSYTFDYQPQGRYILPMLVSLCILIALGFTSIEKIIQKMNVKFNIQWLLILLEVCFIVIQLYCLHHVYGIEMAR